MHILFYNLTSNSSKKNFSFSPVQRQPGGPQHLNLEAKPNFFKDRKTTSQKETFSEIIYPLTPKTNPIITVYAKVSELVMYYVQTRGSDVKHLPAAV